MSEIQEGTPHRHPVPQLLATLFLAPFIREGSPLQNRLNKKTHTSSALLWGGLTATALPPLFFLPLGLLGFAAWFLFASRAPSWRAAVRLGLAYGFGFFLGGLWWIAVAFRYEEGLLAWLGAPIVIGLSGFLAFFWVAVSVATWLVPMGLGRIFAFAGAVLGLELLRGVLFGGFPWNPPASLWSFSALTLQPLAWLGSDLWGAITVLGCAAGGLLWQRRGVLQSAQRVGVMILAVLPIVVLGFASVRLMDAPALAVDSEPTIQLRILQPAIPQEDKWDKEARRKNLSDQYDLLAEPGAYHYAILPEATVAWPLNSAETVRTLLASAIPQNGAMIIGGTTRFKQEADSTSILHNSLYLLDDGGAILERYDKHRLVPFGEYTPLGSVLPLTRLTNSDGLIDYTPGTSTRTLNPSRTSPLNATSTPQLLNFPHLPAFSPLICYEVIFSGRVALRGAERPHWLVNITNDAWFGRTSGPYQHFAAARMRSVEEGLPLVRAANNGISAVIDSHGRVRASLPLGTRGLLDETLPRPLPPTPFSQFGLLLPLVFAGVFLGIGVFSVLHARHRQEKSAYTN